MKKSFPLFIAILFFACSNPNKDFENVASDYPIIPKPVSLEMQKGRFLVNSKTKITGDYSLKNEGNYLADMLSLLSHSAVKF